MKVCTKCNIEKPADKDHFYWNKRFNSFLSECKSCFKLRAKEYRENNPEKRKEQSKKYYENNQDIIIEKQKEYSRINKDKIKEQQKEYRKNKKIIFIDPIELPNKIKTCVKCNIEKSLTKKYFYWCKYKNRFDNLCKDCSRIRQKEYQKNNRDKINIYYKNKYETDPNYKIQTNFRGAINKFLKSKGLKKNGSRTFKLMGYTSIQLKEHLESLFEPWMTWDNWGGYNPDTWNDNDSSTWTWQLDHIIPQAEFKLDSLDHLNLKKCWALSNLRPLSAKQNLLDGVNRTRHKKIKK